MYEYFYSFTTNKPMDNMQQYEEEILEAIEYYNTMSATSHIYKHIKMETITITKKSIEFHFQIATSIDNNLSLRPLHLLSSRLLKIEGLGDHVRNKRFLKPNLIYRLSGPEKIESLTDVEVVKEIMDIYFTKGEGNEKKELKNKITEMVTAFAAKK